MPAMAPRTITIVPNRALTASQALGCFALLAVSCLGVGVYFALLGFWPVLPFAGLEVALLAYALRASWREGDDREQIAIDDQRVVIDRRRRGEVSKYRFPRPWVKLALKANPSRHYPSRLMFVHRGDQVEVGRCLTEPERQSLARRLRSILG